MSLISSLAGKALWDWINPPPPTATDKAIRFAKHAYKETVAGAELVCVILPESPEKGPEHDPR